MARDPGRPKAECTEEVPEQMLDETLAESFPASDPPFWTLGWCPARAAPDVAREGEREDAAAREREGGAEREGERAAESQREGEDAGELDERDLFARRRRVARGGAGR
jgi:hypothetical protein